MPIPHAICCRLGRLTVAVSCLLGTPMVVQGAPTFTVNSTNDAVASAPLDNGICETAPGNGVCTLRAAVMKANHVPGGEAAIMLPPGIYILTIPQAGVDDETTGDLNITAKMRIVGGGASTTLIDGDAHDRLFAIALNVSVNIDGVTIRNGLSDLGGGIFNRGVLTLTNSTVSGNNAAAAGGGVYNDALGTATITNSTVAGNNVESTTPAGPPGGGGLSNSGTMMIVNSTVANNSTTIAVSSCENCGGAILNVGALIITNSTVSGNTTTLSTTGTCTNCGGGGVHNRTLLARSGTVVIINSTVSGNSTNADGGGIFTSGGSTRVSSSTITQNTAGLFRTGVESSTQTGRSSSRTRSWPETLSKR